MDDGKILMSIKMADLCSKVFCVGDRIHTKAEPTMHGVITKILYGPGNMAQVTLIARGSAKDISIRTCLDYWEKD